MNTELSFIHEELWGRNERVMMQEPYEREKLENLAKQNAFDPDHPVHYQLQLWRRFEYSELSSEKLKDL